MFQKAILSCILLLLPFYRTSTECAQQSMHTSQVSSSISALAAGELLYEKMELSGKVNFLAFRQAVAGYNQIKEKRRNVLTLIDFSKPSTEERLFVFDMDRQRLLFSSVVSHGKNSGENYATSFSNQNGSNKSSLGFYLTEYTYSGKNGYSLVLNGLEKGINDKAKERAIVVHGAAYANPSVALATGRLGRSLGCPALPQNTARPIINAIKGGSVIFIYANSPQYLAESSLLQGAFNVQQPYISIAGQPL